MDPKDRGKRVGSFLDKISTLSRGKDKKEKGRCDIAIIRQRTIEELARDEQQMSNFQQTINRLSDYEINSKFEQLLDDMNLTEEKKAPLRDKKTEEKRALLAMQFKGSIQPKGKIDSPEEFIDTLNSADVRGERRYEIISSLRVALTNNTVTWVLNFGKRNGLNAILRTLNYCYENKLERRSTLECIKCMRAYTNNRSGLMEMVNHEEALTLLSRCIDPRDPPSMLEAVKLLAAICLVPPEGQRKVLEGITICSELRGHDRFLPIVQGLSMKDWQIKIACLQLINSIVSTPDELEFRLHLRNEFMRTGLAESIEHLERVENEEVKTHIRIFVEHRDEDAEEIYHHFDNIRFEMDDPKECFDMIFNSTLDTPAEPYFLSILQHLLSIREDMFARTQYFKMIEECVSQIVLNKQGLDPDFRYTKRFLIDVEPLLGRISDEAYDDSGPMSTAPRQFRSKLEEALTAKQEFEAKVSTLDEKVKLYEAEINDLKLRISQGVGAAISSSLASGGPPCTGTHLPPPPPPPPGTVPPPPPLAGLRGFPAPPGAPPLLLSGVPPPPGAPFVQPIEQLPSFVKPKKKYNPEMQMKRANWVKINVKNLEKDSFWVNANEERLAKDDIFKGLIANFAAKVITVTRERLDSQSSKKCKGLKVLDARAGQNLSILLGSVKVSYEEIRRRIIEMDEENLTVGLMEQLIKYLPLPDQMKQLEAFRDEYDILAEPEQFAIVMSGIKRLVPRLTSMTFKMKFGELVSELKPDIVAVTAGLEEVKQSRKFARVLELVLLMGNYMNAGSRNEQTYGFELSFLPKLVNTKTLDNKRTLMHYLVEIAEKHFPDVVDLSNELFHIEKAARVSEENLQKNLTLMIKSVKQLEIDVKNVQQDKNTPSNDKFLTVMTQFANIAKEQCEVLEGMHKKMTSLYLQTGKFFCFDVKKYGIEEFFSDLKMFLDAFAQSLRDLALEKEAAEKAKRVREAQERRDRERREKTARTNAIVDMNNEDDQEGVMDNLLEALKTGSAFNVCRERKDAKKRTPRAAGAERRAQLARSRSRQNVLSPDAGGSSGTPLREINIGAEPSLISTPVAHSKRTPKKGSGNKTRRNLSSHAPLLSSGDENDVTAKTKTNGHDNVATRSEAEELLERLRAL